MPPVADEVARPLVRSLLGAKEVAVEQCSPSVPSGDVWSQLQVCTCCIGFSEVQVLSFVFFSKVPASHYLLQGVSTNRPSEIHLTAEERYLTSSFEEIAEQNVTSLCGELRG